MSKLEHAFRTTRLAILAGALAAAWPAAAADPASVAYPKGYRNWAHVKSMVIQPGHPLHASFGGIHHIYANAAALRGYAKGRFPDGSVIVFDLLEANSADNAVQEGARKVVGVMVKDSRRHAATGGWGYEGFKGDSRTERAVGDKAASACHACHESQKARDYVFSSLRP
jgi:Cytochrome P460